MASQEIAERRELERFPVMRSVELTTSRAPNDHFPGRILDFSEHGLRISTGRLIQKGEMLTVHWGHTRLAGKVVHCRPQKNGSVFGISLSAKP